MFKRETLRRYKESEGKINIIKEPGKETTGQFYYGEPAIILTMIASMANTLIVKNKVFTKEQLIEAINIGSREHDESE